MNNRKMTQKLNTAQHDLVASVHFRFVLFFVCLLFFFVLFFFFVFFVHAREKNQLSDVYILRFRPKEW